MASVPLTHIEDSAWRGWHRVHAGMTSEMSARLSAAHSLTLAEFELLQHLSESSTERMPMSELARLVSLTPSGITRMVDRLVQRNLVARQAIRSDARVQHAVLTDAGRSAFVAAQQTYWADIREKFVNALTETELGVLATVWSKLETAAS